jgi:Leu/Phe-tRNA-protein transferase
MVFDTKTQKFKYYTFLHCVSLYTPNLTCGGCQGVSVGIMFFRPPNAIFELEKSYKLAMMLFIHISSRKI